MDRVASKLFKHIVEVIDPIESSRRSVTISSSTSAATYFAAEIKSRPLLYSVAIRAGSDVSVNRI